MKNIKEIESEFDKLTIGGGGLTQKDARQFISSSVTLLLEKIEKDLPRMYSNKELMLKSGTNDYYWMKSKNDTLEEVIKIIIKRY
jgi:hypothetical protein